MPLRRCSTVIRLYAAVRCVGSANACTPPCRLSRSGAIATTPARTARRHTVLVDNNQPRLRPLPCSPHVPRVGQMGLNRRLRPRKLNIPRHTVRCVHRHPHPVGRPAARPRALQQGLLLLARRRRRQARHRLRPVGRVRHRNRRKPRARPRLPRHHPPLPRLRPHPAHLPPRRPRLPLDRRPRPGRQSAPRLTGQPRKRTAAAPPPSAAAPPSCPQTPTGN